MLTIAFGSGGVAHAASKAADKANNTKAEARRKCGRATGCIFLMSPTVSTGALRPEPQEPKHPLDKASDALIPFPLCAGILYQRINRLWSEPGKIMARAGKAIGMKSHSFSSTRATLVTAQRAVRCRCEKS
ncbi:hypothetical protein [Mesorhizobium sp. STM 4661]|uniref:hypothetical protein n=1 Tax=Mesorhizobium sp. STM 4661 TaxID=1297570 RepID=UPI0018DED1A0|nr:hypothetical protein [Mesorhizobium sp. STM 4661]